MTTYYLLNDSKRYDAMMKKIKAVAKQTKTRILSMNEEIRQETEEVPYTVTRVVIG
jgi:uncharacterized protein YPO0396